MLAVQVMGCESEGSLSSCLIDMLNYASVFNKFVEKQLIEDPYI